jgi:uncharacterized protein
MSFQNDSILEIKVVTRASKSAIKISESGDIKVFLNSPPIDGKANKECILMFSKKLKIAKSKILIEKGEKSKFKKLKFIGINEKELWQLLEN